MGRGAGRRRCGRGDDGGDGVRRAAVGRWVVVDVTWGLGFIVITALAEIIGDGDALRRVLLALLPAIWGARLASHVLARARDAGEGPRYQKLRDQGDSLLKRVLVPQGLAMFVVSLPIQIGVGSDASVGFVAWLGGAGQGDRVGLRDDRRPAARGVQGRLVEPGPGAERRALALHPAPELLRRRHLVVGVWLVAADSGWAGIATIVGPSR